SDRVAVFEDGVIQQLSSPQELYENPQNSFVAQFIGENNKLNGTVEKITKDTCDVKLDDGSMVKAHKVKCGTRPRRPRCAQHFYAPRAGSPRHRFEGQPH
ncbi:MAG: hypothetical protein AAGE85_11945, partial [Pseudomonadota bacterium]